MYCCKRKVNIHRMLLLTVVVVIIITVVVAIATTVIVRVAITSIIITSTTNSIFIIHKITREVLGISGNIDNVQVVLVTNALVAHVKEHIRLGRHEFSRFDVG